MIGRGGRLIYKSEWTSAANIEAGPLTAGPPPQTRHRPIAPYITEQLKLRDVDREAFYERLRRNGERVYDEFERAEEIWRPRT